MGKTSRKTKLRSAAKETVLAKGWPQRMSAVTWAKNCRCSSTVRVSHSMLCWGHSPRLLLTPSMSSLMSWPLIRAVPLVGGMKPVGSAATRVNQLLVNQLLVNQLLVNQLYILSINC